MSINNYQQYHIDKQRIEQLLRQGNLPDAKSLAQKCCQELPGDAESHYLLALVLRQEGNLPAAIESLKKATSLQPEMLVALRILGATFNQVGNFIKGEQSLRDALTLDPHNTVVITHLAFSLINQKRYPAAENLLLNAAKNGQTSADIFSSLGLICAEHKRFKEAISHYERACQLDSRRTGLWVKLGQVLMQQGNVIKAIESFEEAAYIEPRNHWALTLLGRAWKQLGDIEKAVSYYKKSLRLSQDQNTTISELAELYERNGRIEEAQQLILSAVNRGISDARIAITLVRVTEHFNDANKAIEYAKSVLNSTKTTQEDKAHLRFALGRYYDSINNYPEAFSHYKQANEFNEVSRDDTQHSQIIDSLIKYYNPDFFQGAPQASNASDQPVFVIGMPRSGTSLTEQILASHPGVHGAGELSALNTILYSLKTKTGVPIQYPSELYKLDADTINLSAKRYLDYIAGLNPTSARIIDKMPDNFIHLGFISQAFPNAHVIHCTRNPLDLCLSIYFQDFTGTTACTTDLVAIAKHYLAYQKFINHIKQVTDLNLLEVSYEELVHEQEKTSRTMIDFLGLEWDSSCLKFHDNKRFVTTPSYYQVRKKMYSTSVDRWKNYESFIPELLSMFN